MPRSAAAVEGLRHNPQVRYIQRMVIGPPPVTAAENNVDAYIYTAGDERLAVGRMLEDPTWRWTLRDLSARVVRELESFGPQKTSQYFVWMEDHFFGDGVLVASEREVAEGGRRHFHVDHLGTPRMVTGRRREPGLGPRVRPVRPGADQRARGR